MNNDTVGEAQIAASHEEALVRAFFLPAKRERYVEFVLNLKKRGKLILELPHFRSLDPRWMVEIVPSHQHPKQIASALTQKGAPQLCWIISENRELDGR